MAVSTNARRRGLLASTFLVMNVFQVDGALRLGPQGAATPYAVDHCEVVFDNPGYQDQYGSTGPLLGPSWDNVEPRPNDF